MTQPMPTLPGMPEQIARYQLLSELGRGSMGHVYLALDPNIDRKVALKVFLPLLKVGAAEQWELRQRFVFEARAAGQLSHPGIVTIFDADTDPDTGLSYLAMEWVNGPSLDDLIRESAPLSVERSTRIAEEVAEALDVAHRQGLVHRDVKPANILLESDGRAKVTDFGIAKLASMSITTTGWIPGSPFYMSPEQIRNESIDRRSDLYALGAVLYQCLTGRLPFEADSLAALTHMILEIDPRPVRSINPEVSAELAAVIDTALSKSPDDRFDSGREFAQALQLARVGKFAHTDSGAGPRPARAASEGGASARLDDSGGTGTIGLGARVHEERVRVGHEVETPERAEPEVETGDEPEPHGKRVKTLIVEPEARVTPRTAPGAQAGVMILDDEPPTTAWIGFGRLLLAAGMVVALVLVAWGLRPVASAPAGGLPPLEELLSITPRFSAEALLEDGGFELPGEPAEAETAPGLEEAVADSGPQGSTPELDPDGSTVARVAAAPASSGAEAVGRTSTPAVQAQPVVGGTTNAAPEWEAASEPAMAVPSSMPAPAPYLRATSKLEIVYRNRLENAVLSVTVDDERVYASELAGRRGFFGKAVGKNVWAALELTPGEHAIDVRITGAGGKVDLVRQTMATFEDGQTHRLRVSVTPLKKLKLTWKDSPDG